MADSPWSLTSWPRYEWYMPTQRRSWPEFVHATTVLHPEIQGRGTTLWVGELRDRKVGLAWDWVEVQAGVVAMVDPNAIMSNLLFLRDQLHCESELGSVVSRTRLVHELPWQRAVVRALRAAGANTKRTAASEATGHLKSLATRAARAPHAGAMRLA
jgi:hypothetical protein